MKLNFEKDMMIDENALDIEWQQTQGTLAGAYNNHYAECCHSLEIAQEEVKTIRSELTLKVNKDPQTYLGVPKATAPLIEAYYRTHPKYIKAKDTAITLEYEKNIAELAKNEINFTRKAALENLVTLLGMNYFNGPRVPRNLTKEVTKRREEIEAREERISKRSTQSMKRKPKKSKRNLK